MVDIQQTRERLKISYIDKNGDISFKEIAIPRTEKYTWEIASEHRCDPVYRSWDDKPVKKVQTNWLSRYRIEEFLVSLGPEYTKELYEFNKPNTVFCDIEVEVGDEFPDPEKALRKILTVTFITKDGHVKLLGLKDLSKKQMENIVARCRKHLDGYYIGDITFSYYKFEEESDMIYSMLVDHIKAAPVLTGWNFVRFDWRYIINRARRLNIDPSICSVSGRLKGKEELPEHKIVVDYLEIYKKWDRVVKMKENNKLDTVSKAALGINKIHLDDSFMNMYETDFETYCFYNVIDTFLVLMLDAKLKTMQVFLQLGLVSGVEALNSFSPIRMVEAVAVRKFYAKHRVVVENKTPPRKGEFEGAYVKVPVPGLYENIAIFDFASLYPTTMRQFNISPETFKGMNVEIPEGANWIKSASGAVFDNENDSVVREILTEFYAGRKAAKGKAFAISLEIDALKKIKKERF